MFLEISLGSGFAPVVGVEPGNEELVLAPQTGLELRTLRLTGGAAKKGVEMRLIVGHAYTSSS
jgi:hypothetical protein